MENVYLVYTFLMNSSPNWSQGILGSKLGIEIIHLRDLGQSLHIIESLLLSKMSSLDYIISHVPFNYPL